MALPASLSLSLSPCSSDHVPRPGYKVVPRLDSSNLLSSISAGKHKQTRQRANNKGRLQRGVVVGFAWKGGTLRIQDASRYKACSWLKVLGLVVPCCIGTSLDTLQFPSPVSVSALQIRSTGISRPHHRVCVYPLPQCSFFLRSLVLAFIHWACETPLPNDCALHCDSVARSLRGPLLSFQVVSVHCYVLPAPVNSTLRLSLNPNTITFLSTSITLDEFDHIAIEATTSIRLDFQGCNVSYFQLHALAYLHCRFR